MLGNGLFNPLPLRMWGRINPREAQIGAPHFSCSGGALEILEQIDGVL